MEWRSPAAFFGEFDAQDGPQINYAFEYFRYSRDLAKCAPPPVLQLVDDVGFVGRRVAGGKLHSNFKEFMREVAARVLTSNEAHEESVLFQDPGCPAVGSFTFCLPDILARGEKRRFCLVFCHQDYETLVSHWPTVSDVVRIAIADWTERTTTRYRQEYRTFPDLERRREEARRKRLRSVATLLSACKDSDELADGEIDDGDATEDAQLQSVKRLLCFFEAALPFVFVPANRKYGTSTMNSHGGAFGSHGDGLLQRRLEAEVVLADATAKQVNFDNTAMLSQLQPFQGNNIAVCPLVIWLREMVSDVGASKSWRAMEALLHALLTGNQIVVLPANSGDDVDNAANLALALAYTLPPSLASVRLFCAEYVMPYVSRIVSLSAAFVASNDVVPFRRTSMPPSTTNRQQFVLSEIESDGVVCVVVGGGQITQVIECDRLVDAVAWQKSNLTKSGGGAQSPTTPGANGRPPSTSTLSQRIALVLQEHARGEHEFYAVNAQNCGELGPTDVAVLRLLDAQVKQLVREYVLRGRVYTALFHAQEVEHNRHVLGSKAPSAANVSRQSLLSTETNRSFSQDRFVFASSTPEDHAVLVFLGSAAL